MIYCLSLFLSLFLVAGPEAREAREDRTPAAHVVQGFDLRVVGHPRLLRVGGRDRLTYELVLTSFSRSPITLQRIEVVGTTNGRIIGVLPDDGVAIAGRPAAGPAIVQAGETAIAYVDLDLPDAPAEGYGLTHRVRFIVNGVTSTVTGGDIAPARRDIIRIAPPLRGGPWAAVYDPRLANGHRRSIYATAGTAVVPGRYAVDWMAASDEPGAGFGADVLAVADGVVLAARDGVPEPERNARRALNPLGDAAGNFIALDIGGGYTAFYEHLAPGLRVRVGQTVRRGDVIGSIGSTGDAMRPHLHFHVATGRDPLAADGLPYALGSGRLVGRYRDLPSAARGGAWMANIPREHDPSQDSLPPPNSVVFFD